MTKPEALVEVWRGNILECTHFGHAVIVDDTGQIVEAWGNPEEIILPRSSCKILQALPLVESGAADAAKLTNTQLALACASHEGERLHTDAVTKWLAEIGQNVEDLQCGTHAPTGEARAHEMIEAGEKPCALHNNCSGKHTGFLTLNKHLGGASDYLNPAHPVQQAARMAIEDMCQEDVAGFAIDGCSAPNFALSLTGLARGMANMGKDRGARLYEAFTQNPLMVAGTGRACSEIMEAFGNRVAVKTGAEGVYTAIIPELGFGVALKITDGRTRASEAAIAALLMRLALAETDHPVLAKRAFKPLTNAAGLTVGGLRPVRSLLEKT